MVAAAVGGAAALVVAVPRATVASVTYEALNGTVLAGSEHVLAGSSAFPNFRTGALDNYYSLAHAHLDGSPFTEGAASWADTGPLGQTLVAGAGFHQPQYADARYPGNQRSASAGSAGGPYATASAGPTKSSAYATLASTLPGGGAPSASAARLLALRAALSAWRAQYLTADDAHRYPMPRASAASPDGADGMTSTATEALDDSGALVSTGDSRVESASFGGGMITLRAIHTAVSVTNAGKPKHSIAIEVGQASVGGVPVVVGQDGVVVAGTQVPGLAGAIQQVSAALNQALASAGYAVRAVAPSIVKSTNQETIDAAAVAVTFLQPAPPPGIPYQNVTFALGEVFDDSLAVPTPPLPGIASFESVGPSVAAPALAPSALSAPSSGALPSYAGPTAPPAAPAPSATQTAGPGTLATAVVHHRTPVELLLFYLVWQALVAATVLSAWWRRTGAV